MPFTKFGPGTTTFTVAGGTAQSFSQEVKGGGVQHSYSDVGDTTTYLDGSSEPGGKVRADNLTLDADFDLGPAGAYAFLMANDLKEATFVHTPSTADGASWSGTVVLQLPDGAVAEGYGGKHSGTITLQGVGLFTFTPTPAGP